MGVCESNAFSVDYTIELEANNDLIPSNIHHTNGNPTIKSGGDPYFTSATKSCHYFGRLIAPQTSTTAIISASMCNKQGIRLDMRVNGETLIIRPSVLYLDDNPPSDQFIVYKLSSFGHDIMIKDVMHSHGVDVAQADRRLLAQENGGDNKVEVLIMIDPSIRKSYEETYDDWYEELTTEITTAINTVSSIYKATDWSYNGKDVVGQITFSIVEFEVVDYTDPLYMDLVPDFIYDNCRDATDSSCSINGGGWLDIIKNWIDTKRGGLETFDNVMMVHRMTPCTIDSGTGEIGCNIAGQGKLGTMCSGASSISHNRLVTMSDFQKTQMSYTMTHEAGHNFNLEHDQNFDNDTFVPRCNKDSGLMGYGDVEDYFSDCSKKDLNAFFEENDLSCLANTRELELITNYGSDAVNGRPTSAPTTSADCYDVSDTGNSQYDRRYEWKGDKHRGRKVYEGETYWGPRYIYKYSGSWWAIGAEIGGNSAYFFCGEALLEDCAISNEDDAFSATPACSPPTPQPTAKPVTASQPTPKPTPKPTSKPTSKPTKRPNAGSSSNGDCWAITGYKHTGPHGCYCYDSLDDEGKKTYSRTVGKTKLYLYCLWNTYWAVDDVVGSTSVKGYAACKELGDECSEWSATYGDCSSAFTEEEACYDEDAYGEAVCVRNNETSTVFGAHSQFVVDSDSGCTYDQPVYVLEHTNGLKYYLHFDLSYDPRWIISAFRISTAAVAVCEKINLFDCVDGSWIFHKADGDEVASIDQATMAISNGACFEEEESETTSAPNEEMTQKERNPAVWLAILVLFALFLIVAISLFIFKQRKKGKGVASFDEKYESQNDAVAADEENDELEVEMETERMTR